MDLKKIGKAGLFLAITAVAASAAVTTSQDQAFTDLAGSGASAEQGVQATVNSLMWIFAFLPFVVSGIFGIVAFKKAKENSDREDNTKELAIKTATAVILSLVAMIIIYGFIGKGMLGAETFGGGWTQLVTQWWSDTLSVQ
ncbi:MAG TPA: hypothetical protein ENK75_05825 [Saprospiraceae bacterium]|nr:hypothetical protein [Saprospiraceae bacterium]